MKTYTKLQCFLTVFLLCFVNLGYTREILGLFEGDICREGDGITANSICRNIESCPVAMEGLKKNIIPIACSYNGSTSIVCCPPEENTVSLSYSANEMCSMYSKLIYQRKKDVISNSSREIKGNDIKFEDCFDTVTSISTNVRDAEPKEFPHMALLGYGETPDIVWGCGGTLISKIFVLTTAHCEILRFKNKPQFANWARLGELDYLTNTDIASRADYKIVERIIHPNYISTSRYHDIGLFRLERDVDFSPFIRPICLNTDNMLRPPAVIATGRGKFDTNWSSRLLKGRINTILAEACDKMYLNLVKRNVSLAKGIVDDLMLCADHPGNDTCIGMSGEPIQIKHNSFPCMYSQIGITSFGGIVCGVNELPTVYTRVSNYISWIERIVWPKI